MNETHRKDRMTMAPTESLAALIALSAGLAGCGASVNQEISPSYNPGVSSLNQPVVQRTDYVLDLAAPGDRLDNAELARLDAWFQSLQLGYGDRIFLDGAYEGSGQRADVARLAADYGLLLSDGAPITAGRVQPGAVRVVVARMSASVPGCPNWRSKEDPQNFGVGIATAPNYGCATNSNLAAMIADPGDLVLGQAGAVSDAATGAKAVRVYRETPPTGTKGLLETTTKGGN
jgi:pilus assembly protein CpaD